ncbi:hypothetical protein JTB14_027813 [Gonioctena quinquepunctata]|nr:hypothetical protein JTB14_027813 [Gonioctena quinquepunctata]
MVHYLHVQKCKSGLLLAPGLTGRPRPRRVRRPDPSPQCSEGNRDTSGHHTYHWPKFGIAILLHFLLVQFKVEATKDRSKGLLRASYYISPCTHQSRGSPTGLSPRAPLTSTAASKPKSVSNVGGEPHPRRDSDSSPIWRRSDDCKTYGVTVDSRADQIVGIRDLNLYFVCRLDGDILEARGHPTTQRYSPSLTPAKLRAVAAVSRGTCSLRQASEQFAVPYTTLNRWVNDKNNELSANGRPPALNTLEEVKFVEIILVCAEWGFPMKSYDVSELEDTLEDLKDVSPSNIINYDETNFSDNPGSVEVVVKRGVKHAHRIIDTSKSSTSVMFAISGDGKLLSPYVVYEAEHLYPGWTEGGFPGSRYNRTPSGWLDSCTFEDWFSTIVLPFMRNLDGPKVIIGDNLCSHLTISVIEQCENNNIRFVLLPPNSTHLLQPLDVAYFRPFKGAWRDVIEKWKLKNRGVLPKTVFPKLLNETIEKNGVTAAVEAEQQDVERAMETTWTDTIVTHLNQMRSGGEQAPKRGKKVDVSAGKSIGAADLLPTLIESEPDELEYDNHSEQDIEINDDEGLNGTSEKKCF